MAHGWMGYACRRRMRQSFSSGEITIAWWVFVLNAAVAFGLNLTMCAACHMRQDMLRTTHGMQRTAHSAHHHGALTWQQQHTAVSEYNARHTRCTHDATLLVVALRPK